MLSINPWQKTAQQRNGYTDIADIEMASAQNGTSYSTSGFGYDTDNIL